MKTCKHQTCGKEMQVWLPLDNNLPSDISMHSWCVNCGKIKIKSDDRAFNIGYWMNILAIIAKNYSLRDVQKRLISKTLEKNECFIDLYNVDKNIQKEIFKKIVTRFCIISEKSIDSLIY